MHPILLATDGSSSAQHATTQAIELARATGWPLRVVTAWSVPASAFGGSLAQVHQLADAEREHAEGALQRTLLEIETAGLEVEGVLRHGEAIAEICDEAYTAHARLIVVGARGWGRLVRLGVGSVSTGVLELAPCPTLVVREPRRLAHVAEAGRHQVVDTAPTSVSARE